MCYATLPTPTHLLSLILLAPALAHLAHLALGISQQLVYMCTAAFLHTSTDLPILL
jgi:hypothetical protein